MISKLYKIIVTLFLILFFSIIYLSVIGIETNKFNNQITSNVKNFNENIDIELKKIKLILDPFNFNFNVKTLGPKIKSNNQTIELELIRTQVSIFSLFNDDFSLKNLEISTKSIEIKRLISFIRSFYKSQELLIINTFIKKGHLIADINLEFNEDGKIKKNFNINGFVRNGKIDLFKKYKFEKINFNFEIENKKTQIQGLAFFYNELDLFIKNINTQNINNEIFVDGEFNTKDFEIEEKFLKNFIDEYIFNFQKLNFDSNNLFSFKLDNKFKVKDLKFKSKIKLNKLILQNNFDLHNFFPKIKKKIILSDHDLDINFDKGTFSILGDGDVLFQSSNDKINYTINKNSNILNFNFSVGVKNNPLFINFLNFKNLENELTKIDFNGELKKNGDIEFEKIFLKNKKNLIKIEKILLNKNLKILRFKKAYFNYFDAEKILNTFSVNNKKNNYFLKGKIFNANNLIETIFEDNQKNLLPFKNNFKLNIQFNTVRLDNEFEIDNFNGFLNFKNNNFTEANLNGFFDNDNKFNFIIKSLNNEKTTILYSDQAKPFINRYKFIEGFEGGILDYYSSSIEEKTSATIKVYDFKLNKLPALTKLLTLASLQGIADLLTGEGIRFNELEMNFDTVDSLMTIKEVYAIGPAISILMDGYIEKNKLISLRGTMVPATTLNKVIGSIPFLGDILVGSKSGEGVFGVSFKIKGPPKKLETSVNPIKTLTPRFITRTLEKIKKTN